MEPLVEMGLYIVESLLVEMGKVYKEFLGPVWGQIQSVPPEPILVNVCHMYRHAV
jgi:hypothetical protein